MASPQAEAPTIDLNQFNAVFFDECAEHLEEMERVLLSLDQAFPDPEALNGIFRAAHSIKGGAGIFGFDDMTVVTHLLESLLDRIRNNETPFSASMTDVFLEAGDVIALQLSGHREGTPVPAETVEQVCQKLQRLLDSSPGAGVVDRAESTEGNPPPGVRRLQIDFAPDEDVFLRGVRVEGLVAELKELGELHTSAAMAGPEDFAGFDPERCYTTWRFTLTTDASENHIRDIFIFAAEDEQLVIRELPGEEQAAPLPERHEPLPSPPEGEQAADLSIQGRRTYDRDETAPGAFGRRSGESEASIRVGISKADQLINQVGELVITQAMLSQVAASMDPVLYETLHRGLVQLERNTRDLQQSIMSIRLVPISLVFNRFPRMVRELAAKLGKQVDLRLVGEGTELDRGLIEKISDPLTHLVRNCLDHGLERAEARTAAGKHPTGTITLKASHLGGRIIIDVIDDGAGLGREKIIAKAVERGISADAGMSDDEVWSLIFAPGFSTAAEITDISGRGVGMDVVLKNVQALGGRVHVDSEPGKGTRITISLPLTLAILDGLSVGVGDHRFILPLNAIVESLQPKREAIKTVNGVQVVNVRGNYLPILPLHELFRLQGGVIEPTSGIFVLVNVEGEQAAIMVDSLLDEHQVVIKSLEENFRKVPGAAGATILGDGKVALILDVPALLEMRKHRTGGRASAGEVTTE